MDEAVGGLAGLSGPLAAEVSGGLDSSIVAASLVRHAPEAVCLWLNATGSTPESDERAYARLLGRALGFPSPVRPSCDGAAQHRLADGHLGRHPAGPQRHRPATGSRVGPSYGSGGRHGGDDGQRRRQHLLSGRDPGRLHR
ncbi:asparagine synthase-related protein [Brevundimonas denitrificans]|uniref:asparagine synthase-related protein n=1 Tax=Brevundimonas denitrificans TaxID=1443434 RepID=UPI00352DBD88